MAQHRKTVLLIFFSSFDIFHYGHANECLQAKQMGTYLVAAVCTDRVISVNKGPPVINEQDRFDIMRGVRFVDEIFEYDDLNYRVTPEMLDSAGCDICVHGGNAKSYKLVFLHAT